MKPTNICLSESEMSKLLSSDLLPSEAAAVEQHIADCETCRIKIESMIGDPSWWNEAQQSLAASSARGLRKRKRLTKESWRRRSRCWLYLGRPMIRRSSVALPNTKSSASSVEAEWGLCFKAFDPRLNRFVAIKMLLPHLASFGAARKRFAREGQAAAAVVNDYVLPIYAVAEWRGVPYLVCQYSRGTTLQTRVQSEGPLELKEVLRLGIQTARGLAAAHAQGWSSRCETFEHTLGWLGGTRAANGLWTSPSRRRRQYHSHRDACWDATIHVARASSRRQRRCSVGSIQSRLRALFPLHGASSIPSRQQLRNPATHYRRGASLDSRDQSRDTRLVVLHRAEADGEEARRPLRHSQRGCGPTRSVSSPCH